jgi:hypothetical protein
MNNTPFILNDLPDNTWSVEWPTFRNITDKVTGRKLLTILFEDIKCFNVGLGVKLNSGEMDTLWVDYKLYWQDKEGKYTDYLEDMYEIGGVVFTEKEQALQLQDILEKKYIWKVLQA